MKRDNVLGHLKLFPEYCRAVELLNEHASRSARILGALAKKRGQEADAGQRGPADDANCTRHNQKPRTS